VTWGTFFGLACFAYLVARFGVHRWWGARKVKLACRELERR
jgi:hypothetical protein